MGTPSPPTLLHSRYASLMSTETRPDGVVEATDPRTTAPLARSLTWSLLGATVLQYLWLLHQMFASTDVFFSDDWEHLLYSRHTLNEWQSVLSVWGRPVTTAMYLPAARGGLSTVHVEDAVLVALCLGLLLGGAWVSNFRWWPAAGLLLLAQPLFGIVSFGAMPQLPFAVVLAAALYLRRSPYPVASLVVASFLPLARLEGIVIVGIWFVLELLARRFKTAPLLGIGVVLWALLGWIAYGDPLWLWKANTFLTTHTKYEAAGFHYFFSSLPITAGGIVGALALFGLFRFRGGDPLVPAIVVVMSIFYAASWEFGSFQTYPTPIYLVTISITIAYLALQGLDELSHPAATPWWRDAGAVILAGLFSSAAILELYLNTPTWIMQCTVVALIAIVLIARFTPPSIRRPFAIGLLVLAIVAGIVATPPLKLTTRHPSIAATLAYINDHPNLFVDIVPFASIAYALGAQHEQGVYAKEVTEAPLGAVVNWDSSHNPILGGVTLDTLAKEGYTVIALQHVDGIDVAFLRRTAIPSSGNAPSTPNLPVP